MTPKEKAFVNAYLGDANGNASAAAIAAGYAKGSAGVTGSRLLKKAKIRTAIESRQAKREQAAIADADERDRIVTECLRSAPDWKDRLKAASELNKVTGRHSSTVNINGRLTLEDALAGSRD